MNAKKIEQALKGKQKPVVSRKVMVETLKAHNTVLRKVENEVDVQKKKVQSVYATVNDCDTKTQRLEKYVLEVQDNIAMLMESHRKQEQMQSKVNQMEREFDTLKQTHAKQMEKLRSEQSRSHNHIKHEMNSSLSRINETLGTVMGKLDAILGEGDEANYVQAGAVAVDIEGESQTLDHLIDGMRRQLLEAVRDVKNTRAILDDQEPHVNLIPSHEEKLLEVFRLMKNMGMIDDEASQEVEDLAPADPGPEASLDERKDFAEQMKEYEENKEAKRRKRELMKQFQEGGLALLMDQMAELQTKSNSSVGDITAARDDIQYIQRTLLDKADLREVETRIETKHEEILGHLHKAIVAAGHDEDEFKRVATELQDMVQKVIATKADRADLAESRAKIVAELGIEEKLKQVEAFLDLKMSRDEVHELVEAKPDKKEIETMFTSVQKKLKNYMSTTQRRTSTAGGTFLRKPLSLTLSGSSKQLTSPGGQNDDEEFCVACSTKLKKSSSAANVGPFRLTQGPGGQSMGGGFMVRPERVPSPARNSRAVTADPRTDNSFMAEDGKIYHNRQRHPSQPFRVRAELKNKKDRMQKEQNLRQSNISVERNLRPSSPEMIHPTNSNNNSPREPTPWENKKPRSSNNDQQLRLPGIGMNN